MPSSDNPQAAQLLPFHWLKRFLRFPVPRHTSSDKRSLRGPLAADTFDSGAPRGPSPATRRPPPVARNNYPPPPYTLPANSSLLGLEESTTTTSISDNDFTFLSQFDTVLLIDDSGSMAGSSWSEVAAALRHIAPICTAQVADGIDVFFLNHRPANPADHQNVTTPEAIERIFASFHPWGGTPTGARLNEVLSPYLTRYAADPEGTKPLNIIMITDGVPSDNVESVIINAANILDKADAPSWQVGIQFFQVGRERGAAEALEKLDNGLSGGGIRDMVDTVPWSGTNGEKLSAEGILKVVLGAVNRRLDRKRDGAGESFTYREKMVD
ncbi:hypothetical protein GP486_004527 [Trichoglossum hirsutum]|uniref:VWFA domain-containing protein n=1 Tax=Trichoglossum hirsutum TaxID=265104 RepID=A0A9P8RNY9_9PEZI|nr:hypothetical protein GP486_004527 [Trichoglossum hirsutum]